jgi:hypothetical protein
MARYVLPAAEGPKSRTFSALAMKLGERLVTTDCWY